MATELPKVFADTNVWASILWTSSSATQAVALLTAGRAPLIVSNMVIEELARFVAREEGRRPRLGQLYRAWVGGRAPWAVVLPDPDRDAVERLFGKVPNEDGPVVAAALAAGATYFLTGDHALLAALPSVGLQPLTPAAVLQLHASDDWPWKRSR